MCGIIGIVGIQPVSDRLIESLKRLEYRGYDSAGIAAQVNGVLERRRAPGKLKDFNAYLGAEGGARPDVAALRAEVEEFATSFPMPGL